VGRVAGGGSYDGLVLPIAVAVAAALVALAFSMSTYERWLARRRRHELAWSVAFALFAVAAATLAYGASNGWGGPAFRVFYLFGAIADVPFLAAGTIYLLAGARFGDRWAAGTAMFVAFAAGVVTVAPFTHPLPHHQLVQGSAVFGPLPRVLAAVASGVGATIVLGGAAWSAIRAGRGPERHPRLVAANALIALGVLILGASGLLNSVVDAMTGFAVALLAGIVVLFIGFLIATTAPGPAAASGSPESPSSSGQPDAGSGTGATTPLRAVRTG